MFGRKSIHDEYTKAISEIDEGQRRKPQHDRPAGNLSESGWAGATPAQQHVFNEFVWFGATLDRLTADPWSIEETSDTVLKAELFGLREHGRRWIVYYNILKLGWLEVSADGLASLKSIEEFRAAPEVHIDMHLSLMRFIPSEDAFGLLYQAAFLMQSLEDEDGYDAARERARLPARFAMTDYLWEVSRAGDQYVPDLDFLVIGPFAVYSKLVADWKQAGFDPIQHSETR